jgi:hypothetical protein
MARHLPFSIAALALSLTACAAPQPLSLGLISGETVEGTAPATAYASTLAGERKQDCRASYAGAASSRAALLEIRCSDGRYGIGTGELRDSRFVGGRVRMQDGEEVLVRPEGS